MPRVGSIPHHLRLHAHVPPTVGVSHMHADHVATVFFFQAEDGIRDHCVTGVQTCALPILPSSAPISRSRFELEEFCAPTTRITSTSLDRSRTAEIGRASCRERV